MNFCPACMKRVDFPPCGNISCNCGSTGKDALIMTEENDKDHGPIMVCPYCSWSSHFTFWEVQGIEIFIAIQQGQGLGDSAKLYQERKK